MTWGQDRSAAAAQKGWAGWARHALLLFVFLLPFMRPSVGLLGLEMVAADAAYLLLLALWGLALLDGSARLRWHNAFWLIGLYFAAMAISALGSEQPLRSAYKLATQVYLLSLPVIAFSLITDERALRRVFVAWLAATVMVILFALASVAAFLFDPASPILAFARNDFGTLPPGDYPRLRLTFVFAAMLCNYLNVSLMILLVMAKAGWTRGTAFVPLLAGIGFSAAFSLTPGLGGIFLALGLWIWLLRRERSPGLARLGLAAGITAAALFVGAMTVTPFLHSTAPFLIAVPGTDLVVAPAVRLMAWLQAFGNFMTAPILGHGIGTDAVHVRIILPSGHPAGVTDAHNVFLNIAVQCGLLGLAALFALLAYAVRLIRPLRLRDGDVPGLVTLGLGFAFLTAFFYHGLGGSFEDSRHLWLLFGLLLASEQWRAAGSERDAPAMRSA